MSVTLLPLLAAVTALQFGWLWLGANTWPAAGAVVTGWALAGAGWLWCRGWPASGVLTVIAVPAVVLAGPVALGWLSPAGLVLWGPVTTVLAVAVAMAAQPLAPIGPPSTNSHLEPGEVTVRGYAWAPPVGVDRVQLQIDGGPWTDAALGIDLGPDARRPWTASWTATPGRHELRVRCRTAAGQWQEEATATPFPHGVRGIHVLPVHVGGHPAGSATRRLTDAAVIRASWAVRSVAAWRRPTA